MFAGYKVLGASVLKLCLRLITSFYFTTLQMQLFSDIKYFPFIASDFIRKKHALAEITLVFA